MDGWIDIFIFSSYKEIDIFIDIYFLKILEDCYLTSEALRTVNETSNNIIQHLVYPFNHFYTHMLQGSK